MGFRFRRSVKIIPGLRLNLSKSGPSLSVGGKGFTTNISKRGTRQTVGLPGSGVSYVSISRRQQAKGIDLAGLAALAFVLFVIGAIICAVVANS